MTNTIKFDNQSQYTRAILAGVDYGEYDAEASIRELEELAKTAKANVVAVLIQRKAAIDSSTCLGEGKLFELKELCDTQDINLVIFDHELTAVQLRNIERILNVAIIDRTMLILDIFASRANSSEGKLQVELAQLKYRLPRLSGIGISLSRLGGGIGTRGPGETKLETDRRHIRRRISKLNEELKELEKRRNLTHIRRKKDLIQTIAIVGYTNVGKSTLLNTLTNANVLAENKLFATLDPTSRGIELPDGRKVLITDTVGLIRRLPHHLIEAFKSTLEQAANADLILHVLDCSDSDYLEKAYVVEELLSELGASHIPVLKVMNKSDLLPEGLIENNKNTVFISAKNNKGINLLLAKISEKLPPTFCKMQLLIPYDKGGVLAQIRKNGKILSEEFCQDGTKVTALVHTIDIKTSEKYKLD
ncbi:MAG: GTPase HflX [Clostridiales bacterium]|nr:GTPase HflX [Clostridiales bacterium]